MTFLLDTHTFLWMVAEENRLSPRVRELAHDGGNRLLLSVGCVWEIMIKARTGRINFAGSAPDAIVEHVSKLRVEILPIELRHTLQIYSLPLHHKDPFDRILIAQAQVEKLPVFTCDPLFAGYNVEVIW